MRISHAIVLCYLEQRDRVRDRSAIKSDRVEVTFIFTETLTDERA